MRNVLSILVCCVLVGTIPGLADSSFDGLFHRGNQHFAAGDFSAAQSVYQSMIKQGCMDSEVLYNLGNCHLKQGAVGEAILRYRQALRIDPHDEDILANLDIARSLVAEKIESQETSGILNWLLSLAWKSGVMVLSITTLILWLGLSIVVVLILFSRLKRNRRKFQRLAVALSILFLMFGGLLSLVVFDIHFAEYAVATGDPVIARSGPGDHFTEVYQQQPGYEMRVKRRQTGYAEVELGNGYTAWVPNSSISSI